MRSGPQWLTRSSTLPCALAYGFPRHMTTHAPGETLTHVSPRHSGSIAEVSYQSKSGPDSLSASTAFVGTAFGVDAVIS